MSALGQFLQVQGVSPDYVYFLVNFIPLILFTWNNLADLCIL